VYVEMILLSFLVGIKVTGCSPIHSFIRSGMDAKTTILLNTQATQALLTTTSIRQLNSSHNHLYCQYSLCALLCLPSAPVSFTKNWFVCQLCDLTIVLAVSPSSIARNNHEELLSLLRLTIFISPPIRLNITQSIQW